MKKIPQSSTLVAIVRDHSVSMTPLAHSATSDYNLLLDGLKEASNRNNQYTSLSIIECGVGITGDVRLVSTNQNIEYAPKLYSYPVTGYSTPLFDSVGTAITTLKEYSKLYNQDTTAFLVMVITDGQDNSSKVWNPENISSEIRNLQSTDKWTFTFRVPRGYSSYLNSLSIPAGNIIEWELNNESLIKTTHFTRSAIDGYYSARAMGVTSSANFYTGDSKINLNTTIWPNGVLGTPSQK